MTSKSLAQYVEERIALREAQLTALHQAARESGATALHLLGSLGRNEPDAFSDIDAWLTFPDARMEEMRDERLSLYERIGNSLLTYEVAQNRPLGGVYSLVLYDSPAGPLQVDWYLAPQPTSRIPEPTITIFEQIPVPRGPWILDSAARQEESLPERINWLTCMLVIAIKKIVRGDDPAFLQFLAQAFRQVAGSYGIPGLADTTPTSLAALRLMLLQLQRYADEQQHQALQAIEAFVTAIGA